MFKVKRFCVIDDYERVCGYFNAYSYDDAISAFDEWIAKTQGEWTLDPNVFTFYEIRLISEVFYNDDYK